MEVNLMKRSTRLVVFLLCLLLFCSCSRDPSLSQTSVVPVTGTTDYNAALSAHLEVGTTLLTVAVPHGEDAPIVWEDAGFESHIRFLLDRPTGDIYRSDVWNIQSLVLMERDDGWDSYQTSAAAGTALDDLPLYQKTHGEEQDLTPVKSLNDLQYFDSLQKFQYSSEPTPNEQLTDFSGLQTCSSLKHLELIGARPTSLEPLAQLTGLTALTLRNCGTMDLSPLQTLPELTHLTLSWSDQLVSLEPLTTLPKLTYLSLASGTTFPSLEPLTRTHLQDLNLALGIGDAEVYKSIDYAPLTHLPDLVSLDLTNHTKVTTKLCTQILAGSPNLQFLNISYTPASESRKDLDVPYLKDTTQVMFSQRLLNKLRNWFG